MNTIANQRFQKVAVIRNTNEVICKAHDRVDYNLEKRADTAKFTSETEDVNLLRLYALSWIVDKLRKFEGLPEYDNLFIELRRIV